MKIPDKAVEAKKMPVPGSIVVYGEVKTGKTTFFRDIARVFGEDTMFGVTQDSHRSITCRKNYLRTWKECEEWKEAVLQMPVNGNRFICADTYDELVELARDRVLEKHDKQTLNEVHGGIGGEGFKEHRRLVAKWYFDLIKSGRIVMGVSHAQWEEIKTGGIPVQKMTSTLSGKAGRGFTKEADAFMLLTFPRIDRKGHNIARKDEFLKTTVVDIRESKNWSKEFKNIQDHQRVLVCHPSAVCDCGVRSESKPFPAIVTVGSQPENTAENFVRIWQETIGLIKKGGKLITDLSALNVRTPKEKESTVRTGKVGTKKPRPSLKKR